MQLGIYLNSQHPDGDDPARRLAETLEQARLIRSLGFRFDLGRRTPRHPGLPLLPAIVLAYARRRRGRGPVARHQRHLAAAAQPVELAELGAFLDVATGGRFLFGIGLGYRPEEYAIYGIPMRQRVGRFMEAIEIIRRLWSEDNVSHAGRYLAI